MNGVSLVLATVGRTQELMRFFDALSFQGNLPPLEVIVVDQNNDDRLQQVLRVARGAGIDITHVRQTVPNLARARNAGVARARYELLAFPDDDCWYGEGALRAVLAAFDADPELGGVVARWEERFPLSDMRARCFSSEEARAFRGPYVCSITLFLRRQVIDDVGEFDERFGVGQWYGAGEESDLVLRALAGRHRIAYEPSAVIHHHYDPRPPVDWRRHAQALRRRSRGTGAVYAKHRLPAWVVLRGLLSPLLMPVLRGRPLADWWRGASIVMGRCEGMSRWWWRESLEIGREEGG